MDPILATYVGEWLGLVVRWLHVVAAIAWVGASFYFIALDHSLRAPTRSDPSIGGEAWEIHGGGVYRIEKFRVAPVRLPESLRWFKWEAYLTWLSGFTLLVLLYYLQPNTYLIDPQVRALEPWQAVGASLAILAFGWLAYDAASRRLGAHPLVLAAAICALVALVAYGSSQLFGARAAYIQVGATIGTWMAANVLFVIIPGQRELVRAKTAGRDPDPAYGARGKQRSVHNNYLTLPAVFAMISQHFPFTYGSDARWQVLLALMAAGAMAQHALNLREQRRSPAVFAAGAFALVIAVAAALAPPQLTGTALTAADFPRVQRVITMRCAVCHSATPTYPGILAAPKGVAFDTPQQMHAEAPRIFQMAVASKLMPLGNATGMTQEERDLLARWVRSGAPIP